MKVRIKFSKEGPVKFVGHLDTMRYFQKAIRRANLPVAFSGGYSPHMIMSFAAPLGVGTESLGEYFDLELAETVPTSEITRRLDAVMVEGVRVISTRQVEDGKAGKAMSLVAAADYYVEFRPGKEPEISWKDKINDFLAQPEIKVMKKTKRSEKAGGLIVWGAIVAVFSVLSIVMNLVNGGEFNVTSVLTGVAVPALYIYGAVLNSKADAQYTA